MREEWRRLESSSWTSRDGGGEEQGGKGGKSEKESREQEQKQEQGQEQEQEQEQEQNHGDVGEVEAVGVVGVQREAQHAANVGQRRVGVGVQVLAVGAPEDRSGILEDLHLDAAGRADERRTARRGGGGAEDVVAPSNGVHTDHGHAVLSPGGSPAELDRSLRGRAGLQGPAARALRAAMAVAARWVADLACVGGEAGAGGGGLVACCGRALLTILASCRADVGRDALPSADDGQLGSWWEAGEGEAYAHPVHGGGGGEDDLGHGKPDVGKVAVGGEGGIEEVLSPSGDIRH
eukprot:764502-Hanusia_phi.AAC.3